MAKNAVLTICIGDIYKRIGSLTHPTIKAYADRIGADFISINKSKCSSPHWEKFIAITNLLNKYERVLYIDTDVIMRPDCPDLFDIVPKDQIGLFNEQPFTSSNGNSRHFSLHQACKDYQITLKRWNGKYYNTGVMVIPRHFKEIFKKPEKEIFNFYEQGYLNAVLARFIERSGNEFSVFDIPHKFNRMTCMDNFTGEERFDSYIIHYAGYPSLEFVLSLINKDIQRWEQDAPDYKYKRHIVANVQGGLGDQVCAEPIIRFMKNRLYPNEDVSVVTHFPRVFEHLDIPVFSHDEFRTKPDTPYFILLSLPGPETPLWSFVSHLMCHSVDYISIAMLKRTLPNEDKRIQLTVKDSDIQEVIEAIGISDLASLILVHPGRHWESKTFPVEWWQAVIDGIAKQGYRVCIIGQEEKTRGTVGVQASDGVIDSRNLLSLGNLIALISKAKVLISNDSAPVHIAGAFDNGIVLIPTCKHPDHLLPYRYGSQNYKAKVLYKKLMCFEYMSQPSAVMSSSAHYVPGKYEDFLPDPEEVIEKTLNLYQEG